MRIVLTPEQWAAFDHDIAWDAKRSALQSCCGNISALREAVIRIGQNGGAVTPEQYARLSQTWDWARNSHAFDENKYPVWHTLKSVIEQAGLPWECRG